ncbi:hypothetical protein SLEP1_g16770 [Rubroshorea leprosula]|uniref:Uncharacterized protein n=1 Tax=Rubroshorea leprosula TaxID=152421 RepID=A0AAV5IVR9_9ROSI|nr:hypothetical protein SLEP1_g16770 [Rubroshorea leprosula]
MYMESSRRIETRPNSQASELTRNGSHEFAEQETTLGEDSPITESMSTEWTDEKHSLYLKSMEASFVNQLYGSMNLLGSNLRNERLSGTRPSRHTHRDAHTTYTGQFKVLRGGSWKKISFERPEFRVNGANRGLVASPWIQHFRSGSKVHVLTHPSIQGMDLYGNHYDTCHSDHLCSHDLIGSDTEVTDQNFADEENGEKASNACSSKKMKTVETNDSSNDQVVP